MRRRTPVFAVVAAALVLGATPSIAGATPAAAFLTGENGGGTFNDRLDCGVENGGGDTWRYFWFDQPSTDPSGVLAGTWNGDFEVHRGPVDGTGFIPGNDGRLALSVAGPGGRNGTAFFDTASSGSCSNADISLTDLDATDPTSQQASGSLPIVATGGLGALRGLTGSGTIDFTLDLTPGADNAAQIAANLDLDVLDPQVSVASGFGRWDNLSSYLNRKLRVWVTLRNATGAGDAFQVRITGASGGTGSFTGLPAGNSTVPHGGGTTIGFVMNNAVPNQMYTVGVKADLKDGLLVSQPPVTGSVTFRAPLLP